MAARAALLCLSVWALALPSALAQPAPQACVLRPVDTEVAISSLIFEGTLIAREGETLRFSVTQTWTAGRAMASAQELDLFAPTDLPMDEGVVYLVYARSRDGRFWISPCGRTAPIEERAEDLRVLGAGIAPVRVGERVLRPVSR